MNQVTMVTSPTCGYCHAAKNLLREKGIDFQEIDVFDNPEQAQQLIQQSGQRTVPQIFINKEPIGGFTELSKLLNKTEVDLSNL